MKMTKITALNSALTHIPETETEVREIITNMITQLSKPRSVNPEAAAAKKEKTAANRAALVATVAPVLRKYLDTPRTAKELFDVAKAELPADFSWNKVQNILIRELAPELTKVEAKGKANTYQIKAD